MLSQLRCGEKQTSRGRNTERNGEGKCDIYRGKKKDGMDGKYLVEGENEKIKEE